VNALPPLKWCSFWANPSLDELSAQGPVPTLWTLMDPVVFSRLRRAAPGELQRPCGYAWSNFGRMVENVSRRARSVDVFQRGRFLFPRQPLTSPLPKSQLHGTRGWHSFKHRLLESSLVYFSRFGGLTERAEALREKPA